MNKVTNSKTEFYHRKIFSKMPVRYLKVNRRKIDEQTLQQTDAGETNLGDLPEPDIDQNPVNTLT